MKKIKTKCAFIYCNNNIDLNSAKKYCCDSCRNKAWRLSNKHSIVLSEDIPPALENTTYHQSLHLCEGPNCNHYAKGKSKYCSNACKQKVWREKNPDAVKSQNVLRSTRVNRLSVLLTEIYHKMKTDAERLNMIKRTLRIALKNTKSDDVLLDSVTYRTMFHNPYLKAGKTMKGDKIPSIVGKIFPQIVAEYLELNYGGRNGEDYTFKRFIDEHSVNGAIAPEHEDVPAPVSDAVAVEEVVETAPTRIWNLDKFMPQADDDNATMPSARNVIGTDEPVVEEKSLSEIIQGNGVDYYNNLIDRKHKSNRINFD